MTISVDWDTKTQTKQEQNIEVLVHVSILKTMFGQGHQESDFQLPF